MAAMALLVALHPVEVGGFSLFELESLSKPVMPFFLWVGVGATAVLVVLMLLCLVQPDKL